MRDAPCILFVVALKPEWAFLRGPWNFVDYKIGTDGVGRVGAMPLQNLYISQKFPQIFLLQTGPGYLRCQKKLEAVFEFLQLDMMVHFGTCGALVPDFKPGDGVVIEKVCHSLDSQKIKVPIPKNFLNLHKLPLVDLLTSESVLATPLSKVNAAQNYGVQVVDMESYASVQIAREKNISCLVIRHVFDHVDEDLSQMGEPYTESGDIHTLKMGKNILSHPKLVFQLPELKRRMNLIQKNTIGLFEEILNSFNIER